MLAIWGLSAGTGVHCPSFVCEKLCFRSTLELNCFLSFVSFVSRHSFSGTHRRNRNLFDEKQTSCTPTDLLVIAIYSVDL